MRFRRQGKNIRPSHHDFADGDVVEFDGRVNHFFLRLGNLAELAAGGDDELEFIRRVNGAAATGFAGTEESQHQTAGAAHEEEQGASEGEESFHGCGDGEGYLLGALEGECFRDELTE